MMITLAADTSIYQCYYFLNSRIFSRFNIFLIKFSSEKFLIVSGVLNECDKKASWDMSNIGKR